MSDHYSSRPDPVFFTHPGTTKNVELPNDHTQSIAVAVKDSSFCHGCENRMDVASAVITMLLSSIL